jgi:AcrR family transcriptional regulator
MAGTPRERAREQTLHDITRIGREHLASHGAAALSLRAVARDLGVVSSAVYRYVKSRDELLTLLVVDAYNELGDEVDAAIAGVPEDDYLERFRSLGRTVRSWALREPTRYALLFGSPVPGYHAPAARTTGPGTRVVLALVRIVDGAFRTGAAAPPAAAPGISQVEGGLAADLAAIRSELDLAVPDGVLARGLLVWSSLFGAVGFEVFGAYGADTFASPAELFEHHLVVLAGLLGLG